MMNDGWKITVVADEVIGYKAEPVHPNLEHAYVYFVEHTLKKVQRQESCIKIFTKNILGYCLRIISRREKMLET